MVGLNSANNIFSGQPQTSGTPLKQNHAIILFLNEEIVIAVLGRGHVAGHLGHVARWPDISYRRSVLSWSGWGAARLGSRQKSCENCHNCGAGLLCSCGSPCLGLVIGYKV